VTVLNCGVLSDFSTDVSLRRAGWSFRRDQRVVGLKGRHFVGVHWLDAQTLTVYLPSSAREHDFLDKKIFNPQEQVDGVRIQYKWL
jgi:hypothetical protein